MSSDSEDLDEDELLQIALKEQSERDLNYRKPSQQQQSSKPLRNYVQPPAHRGGSAQPVKNSNSIMPGVQQKTSNSNRSNNNQQRKVMEDDDDSEVEMLSISSGDEDSSSKDRAGVGGRGKAGTGAGGRGARDDDKGWDGDEPDCWKHVDESELGRRVREMRETRAVPVTQKIEVKTAAMAKKGLSSLQSLPRGMEWIDPLGLGIIDHKTFRLMSDSGPPPSLTEKDHLDANAREGDTSFSLKHYNAIAFLGSQRLKI